MRSQGTVLHGLRVLTFDGPLMFLRSYYILDLSFVVFCFRKT